jgi:PAS domain-containing protein
MRIRDEIRLGVGALLAIQVLTMIAAVALLARMTPAIGEILENNEKSIRAVERMLLALAEPEPRFGEPDLRSAHFERALTEAEGNITEPEEEPVLARIAEYQEAALLGDAVALAIVREELWRLGDINRQSMLASNARAKRLGTAGAWVLVFLGLLGVVFSLSLMRRARAKLIRPVYELGAVLEACRAGDVHRRFNPSNASLEFREVAEVVNQLVTEHFAAREQSWEPSARLDRVALLRLLDAQTEPVLVCDPSGAIAAANEAALELLSGTEGNELRAALTGLGRGEPVESITVEPLGAEGFVCRYRPGSDGESSLGSVVPSFGASLDSDSD